MAASPKDNVTEIAHPLDAQDSTVASAVCVGQSNTPHEADMFKAVRQAMGPSIATTRAPHDSESRSLGEWVWKSGGNVEWGAGTRPTSRSANLDARPTGQPPATPESRPWNASDECSPNVSEMPRLPDGQLTLNRGASSFGSPAQRDLPSGYDSCVSVEEDSIVRELNPSVGGAFPQDPAVGEPGGSLDGPASAPNLSSADAHRMLMMQAVMGRYLKTWDKKKWRDCPNAAALKRTIQDLVFSINPNVQLEPEVENLLLDVADEFIESVTDFGCRLAQHRGSDTLEVKDLQLHLERNLGIRAPEFPSDTVSMPELQSAIPGVASSAFFRGKERAMNTLLTPYERPMTHAQAEEEELAERAAPAARRTT